MQKSKEVDEGMTLQNKLLQLIQTNAFTPKKKGKKIKDNEEKASTVDSLKEKFDEFQEEVRRKDEELDNSKELSTNLLRKMECQAAEILNYEQKLSDYLKERDLLLAQVGTLEEKVGWLQNELMKRTEEVERERMLREQKLKQNNVNCSKILMYEQQLREKENSENFHIAKIRELEDNLNNIQVKLRGRGNESAEGKASYDSLLKVIELKETELRTENEQRRVAVDAFKRLKSQYEFLLKKKGLTNDNMLPPKNLKDITSNPLSHNQHPTPIGVLADEKGPKSAQPSSSSRGTKNIPAGPKSAPLAGSKRPASSWRETRSRPGLGGPDPHDDFFNTPLEMLKENSAKPMQLEDNDIPMPELDNVVLDSSDDETQDPNAIPALPKRQSNIQVIGKTGYKYIEPVRKKADREKLKGIECKQCKKFYDAVLPNNGGKDAEGNKQNLRCEHHEGVSRHRYKYAPPLTPEGFWNIGFESEM
ncbi:hypothetical protein ACFE04_000357 [Oxalis oulophora]